MHDLEPSEATQPAKHTPLGLTRPAKGNTPLGLPVCRDQNGGATVKPQCPELELLRKLTYCFAPSVAGGLRRGHSPGTAAFGKATRSFVV